DRKSSPCSAGRHCGTVSLICSAFDLDLTRSGGRPRYRLEAKCDSLPLHVFDFAINGRCIWTSACNSVDKTGSDCCTQVWKQDAHITSALAKSIGRWADGSFPRASDWSWSISTHLATGAIERRGI